MSYAPAPPPARSPLVSWLAVVQTLVLVALIFVLMRNWGSGGAPNPPSAAVIPSGNLADDEKATIELFRNASQSTAFITTSALQRDAFTFDVQESAQGAGSGFVWDSAGHIVTNFHVVEQGSRWKVTLEDQSTWDAEVVGVAPDRDVAVLKIDADTSRLHPVRPGTSSNLQVGQKVFAIGNPFGLDQTLTTGVISGLGRQIRARTNRLIEGVIQTDASINPGNSGGPLLNSSGEVIGVNTAIYSPSGASAGIGFAIPIDVVKRIVPQLIEHGRVIRPGLGVRVAADPITQRLGIKGVLIVNVVPGGPAEAAGLQPTRYTASRDIALGDVIVAVDDRPVTSSDQFFTLLESYSVGDSVKLKIVRDIRTRSEKKLEVPAKLVAVE